MCDVASDDNYIYLYPLSLQSEGDTSIDGSYRNIENRGTPKCAYSSAYLKPRLSLYRFRGGKADTGYRNG